MLLWIPTVLCEIETIVLSTQQDRRRCAACMLGGLINYLCYRLHFPEIALIHYPIPDRHKHVLRSLFSKVLSMLPCYIYQNPLDTRSQSFLYLSCSSACCCSSDGGIASFDKSAKRTFSKCDNCLSNSFTP